jgi:ParB/RepB/Spo0J family partition protein
MKATCPDNSGLPAESHPAFTDVSVRHRVLRFEQSKYEVVIGALRLKAARLAELESVPVRVVKLTDAEAIETQVVENLQREVHPPARRIARFPKTLTRTLPI